MTSSPMTSPSGDTHGCASSLFVYVFGNVPRPPRPHRRHHADRRHDEPAVRILWTAGRAGRIPMTPPRVHSVVPSSSFMRDPLQMCGGIIVVWPVLVPSLISSELNFNFGDVALPVPSTNQTCVSRLRERTVATRSGPSGTSPMPRVEWSDEEIFRGQTQQ